MPRTARLLSATGYYHVMLRGINRQNIFEDDKDRQRFLDTLFKSADETDAELVAWCLMNNHVHLLVHSSLAPNTLIKKIGCSYVPYFNKKYDRSGHLFQDRYRSEIVQDERYLLGVIRYIHRNPEKAGISRMAEYPWSSYQDYLSGSSRTASSVILSLLSGIDGFTAFMAEEDGTEYLENTCRLSERDAVETAKAILPEGLFMLQNCDRTTRKTLVRKLVAEGLSPAQVCRITGLGKTVVYGALR